MLAQRETLEQPAIDVSEEPDVTLLVRRAQGGDRDAFEAIYRRHVDRVYALCLRMTADSEQALARTQDAFVKAWLRLGSFRGNSRLGTWLHRLTVNVVLDHRRSRSRDATGTQASELDDDFESAARTRDVAGLRLDLEHAVALLPERARTVFVLHDVEGYKLSDVAEMMGTAVGTAKAQLHRARRLLREVLAS